MPANNPIVKVKIDGYKKLRISINDYIIESAVPEDDSINPTINFFNDMLIWFEINPKFFHIKTLELDGNKGIELINYLKDKKVINKSIDFGEHKDVLTIKVSHRIGSNLLSISINGRKYYKIKPWSSDWLHNEQEIVNEWNKLADVIDAQDKKINKAYMGNVLEINEIGLKAKKMLDHLKENDFLPKGY
jgi:hypothetical protein